MQKSTNRALYESHVPAGRGGAHHWMRRSDSETDERSHSPRIRFFIPLECKESNGVSSYIVSNYLTPLPGRTLVYIHVGGDCAGQAA